VNTEGAFFINQINWLSEDNFLSFPITLRFFILSISFLAMIVFTKILFFFFENYARNYFSFQTSSDVKGFLLDFVWLGTI